MVCVRYAGTRNAEIIVARLSCLTYGTTEYSHSACNLLQNVGGPTRRSNTQHKGFGARPVARRCRRCFGTSHTVSATSVVNDRSLTGVLQYGATVEGVPQAYSDDGPSLSSPQSSQVEDSKIRRQLRLWEVNNPERPTRDSLSSDLSESQSFGSTLSQPQDYREFGDVDEDEFSRSSEHVSDKLGLVDFGEQRSFLRLGDLVELR
jgi:hypothetical protein